MGGRAGYPGAARARLGNVPLGRPRGEGQASGCCGGWSSDCLPATGATPCGLTKKYVPDCSTCRLWRESIGRTAHFPTRGQEGGLGVPNTPADRAATRRGQPQLLRAMDQRIPREAGDERADVFAELYEAHYRPLVALCRRLTGPRDAEELAQEAFLRAWSSWERYAPTRPFWPWVSTIARRLCIDHGRRRQTAQLRGPFVLDGHRSAPTPEELVELGEEYRWARAALEELRPDQRRVIRLRDVEGWSYDRIASHEGVTVESVRGSLRRARSRLRLVYARMSSTSSVILLLGLLRSARRRLSEVSHRIQSNAASAGVLSGRAADAVAALVVLAMGTVPTAVTAGSGASALAAARRCSGVVRATAA